MVVIFVNTAYLIYRGRITNVGATFKFENGYTIHDYVKPGSPLDRAGITPGDTLVSINSIPIDKWEYIPKVGDTLIAGILRNNKEVSMCVIVGSFQSITPGFFWSMYIITILFSIGSLHLLFKKPKDKSVKLFFICIQMFMVTVNSLYLNFKDPMAVFAITAFIASGCFLGPVLIHFHLLFPRPAKFFSHYKKLPSLLYVFGSLIFTGHVITYFYWVFTGNKLELLKPLFDRAAVLWMTLTFFIALAIAVFQFRTIKDTLSRNQLRIVITGSFFGFITPMSISLFYDYFNQLSLKYPHLIPISQGIGSMILICCILIAIFRYRIWDIEVILRKALLYLGATLIIVLSYLFSLFLVDVFTINETKATRFLILAISVLIFLALRDWLQRLIDRIFHRETYDSATVVFDFEEKLAGIYRLDELKSMIVRGLDDIFHFKSFVLTLKKDKLTYEPAFVIGSDYEQIYGEFEINPELENKLCKSKVFSPGELQQKPSILEVTDGELVIPLLKDDHPFGFFICGKKKSEKTYSMQDIRVLSLIAKRIIALFHTASLYQKDLDRQLMLERERARISQDMHDDIGAGLTKIAMISESKTGEQGTVSSERMLKVATTARDMISRLNVIVWALNPMYDNLDSLISYVRRYFGEYLENFGINFIMNISGDIPDLPVSPDFRRNAFYAWQEAIHNAVKHGVCSEIHFMITFNSQTMLVTISDNGKGFDQAKPGSGGNGLLNMKKRAEELGGSFEIESVPGKGTRVVFGIPLAS
jgi:signal transduction histidine kinase